MPRPRRWRSQRYERDRNDETLTRWEAREAVAREASAEERLEMLDEIRAQMLQRKYSERRRVASRLGDLGVPWGVAQAVCGTTVHDLAEERRRRDRLHHVDIALAHAQGDHCGVDACILCPALPQDSAASASVRWFLRAAPTEVAAGRGVYLDALTARLPRGFDAESIDADALFRAVWARARLAMQPSYVPTRR